MLKKRIFAIISSVVIASSMLVVSASAANTGDTYYTYSWGDCRIAWSPDTANAYNYSSLN